MIGNEGHCGTSGGSGAHRLVDEENERSQKTAYLLFFPDIFGKSYPHAILLGGP